MVLLFWLVFCVFTSGVTADDVADIKAFFTARQTEADSYLIELKDIKQGLDALHKSYWTVQSDIRAMIVANAKTLNSDQDAEGARIKAIMEATRSAEVPIIIHNTCSDKILHINSIIGNASTYQNEKLMQLGTLHQQLLQKSASLQPHLDNWKASSVEVKKYEKEFSAISKDISLMKRQVQLQQFNEEEKTRSDGNSGIKQIREVNAGIKTYDSNTFTGTNFASMHNHENFKNTAGIGEFVAVLNGFEFRTRHNDYELKQAVANDLTFHKTEDVEHPDVPPEVTAAGNVSAQIVEMKEWFLAFKNQDFSVRDYRKYFPAVMCYLEGAFEEISSEDLIDKPLFASGSREMNASTYAELYEKIRYTSYSGEKERSENLANLPRTIMDIDDDGNPVLAQWNYRILCHKLKNDLQTSYLDLMKDITSQKLAGVSDEQYANSMLARFNILGRNYNGHKADRGLFYSYLDLLMEEVPGKNNYGASITANGFESEILSANPSKAGQQLNGANYHRPYKLKSKDAMGVNTAQRGYADLFYFALTTQEKIVGMRHNFVSTDTSGSKQTKASFAVPIEIIYLNPLAKWNPYNVPFNDISSQDLDGKTPAAAFQHNSKDSFYQTPAEFFENEDPEKIRHVKTGTSTATVHASGLRVMLPDIEGVGQVRQRYPIMPVYSEGTSLSKKLNAYEDVLNSVPVEEYELYATGISSNQIKHTHIIKIARADYDYLKSNPGSMKTIKTERTREHEHHVGIKYENNSFFMTSCDSDSDLADATHFCWDGHEHELTTSH